MKRTHYFVFIILIVLIVSACESPVGLTAKESLKGRPATEAVTSKANVDQFRVKFELPLSLTIPCIAEEVAIGGGVRHLLVHEVANDNGYLYRFHLNHSQIVGIGSETGNEYVGQFVLNEHEVSFTEKGQTRTLQEHIHGISRGASPRWFVSILMHLTLNADGDLTAETEFANAACRS